MNKPILKDLAVFLRQQIKVTGLGAIDRRLLEMTARVVNCKDGPALRVHTEWNTPDFYDGELTIYLSVEQDFTIGWSNVEGIELPGKVELARPDAFERVWRRTLDRLQAHAERVARSVARQSRPGGVYHRADDWERGPGAAASGG
jgi:hypothetical protein